MKSLTGRFFSVALIIIFLLNPNYILAQGSPPPITSIATNASTYPNSEIPKYEKFEISFQVSTIAQNLQFPYDASPPAGITAGQGITVNGLFTPDNWQTVYTQPAFYYQDFTYQTKLGQDWMYPSGGYSWKVRFAPSQEGTWQFKLSAQDSGGTSESQPQSFTVISSSNKGFIKVSDTDTRYFEFEDGTYFPALGYNMNFDHISWRNPVLENQTNFTKMGQNGIQLVRMWLSQWSIFDSPWNAWQAINPALHAQYIPYSGIVFSESYPGSDVSMQLSSSINSCMFIGFIQSPPAIKRNMNYQVEVRYKLNGITGPSVAGQDYGFVTKTGSWLWGTDQQKCNYPATGTLVTSTDNFKKSTTGWEMYTGTLNSIDNDFLPYFYVVLENTTAGEAYIDYVSIREDLGNNQYSENIIYQPWMAHHQYFDQRNSFAFDKVLDLAKQNDVYLRPVILEKNSPIFNNILPDGTVGFATNNTNFYGNWRVMTKTRWLQQAWWRYLQARWGYSPNIHSWELLNEGNPYFGQHHTLADEFGKYMHQFTPNNHLVSTSNWASFPREDFWANPNYPDIDFADVHLYIPKDWNATIQVDDGIFYPVQQAVDFFDSSKPSEILSNLIGAKTALGAGKPVIRGETGLTNSGTEPGTNDILADTQGVWLHNFIWSGINPGGLIESYWYENTHIYNTSPAFDHRPIFKPFYDFISSIPLSNGNYQDVQATSPNANIKVLGQKDLVNYKAHIWVQNKNYTWKNAVDGVIINPITTTVTIPGFPADTAFNVNQWNTLNGGIASTQAVTTNPNGDLIIPITSLTTDTAFLINSQIPITATPTPTIGGATTTVNFFPLAGDGRVAYFGPASGPDSGCGLAQWNTAKNSQTGIADYTTSPRANLAAAGCQGSNFAVNIGRGYFPFDTSTLPDNAVITDAKLHLYVTAKTNLVNDANSFITVVQSNQASPSLLSPADYPLVGSVAGSNNLTLNSITANSDNVWTLNTTGQGWISTTGNTLLAIREGHDLNNAFAYAANQANAIAVAMSEQTGTNQDPYLEITYTLPGSPSPTPIPGDADGDLSVTLNDFIVWKTQFLNPTGTPTADFDGNGVGLSDFIIWKTAFISG